MRRGLGVGGLQVEVKKVRLKLDVGWWEIWVGDHGGKNSVCVSVCVCVCVCVCEREREIYQTVTYKTFTIFHDVFLFYINRLLPSLEIIDSPFKRRLKTYCSTQFIHEATQDSQIYLEWHRHFNGQNNHSVNVLILNPTELYMLSGWIVWGDMNYNSVKLLKTRTELGIWDYSPCLLTSKSENKKVICNTLITLIESG